MEANLIRLVACRSNSRFPTYGDADPGEASNCTASAGNEVQKLMSMLNECTTLCSSSQTQTNAREISSISCYSQLSNDRRYLFYLWEF